jgi:hypothetical protein
MYAFGVVFLLFGAATIANAAYLDDWGSVAFGAFLVLMGLFELVLLLSARRPIKVDAGSLRVPGMFLTATTIPADDVAGVGLRFGYGRREVGWTLWIWQRDGTPIRTQLQQPPIPIATTPDGHKPPGYGKYGFDPVIHEDADRLRQTPVAMSTWAIYMDVLSLQGPAGPLATLELQRHAPVKPNKDAVMFTTAVRAWWSPPNGDMGHPDT